MILSSKLEKEEAIELEKDIRVSEGLISYYWRFKNDIKL